MTAISSGEALWTIFVEDASRHAAHLCQRLGAGSLDRAACSDLAAESFVLASIALLMGVEDLGRLAVVCEEAFDRLGRGSVDQEELEPALATAAAAITTTMDALARPGSSGALVPSGPLGDARRALVDVLSAIRPDEPGAPAEVRAGQASGCGAATAGPAPETAAPAAGAPAGAGAARAAGATPALGAQAAAAPVAPAAVDEGLLWVPEVDEDMIDLFVDEANEKLEGLAGKLLALEERPGDGELVREVFRDLHTVKGSSGMVGLKPMNRLAHAAEDLVGQLRDGARRPDRGVVNALLAALDLLRELLARAVRRAPMDVDLAGAIARLRDPGATPPSAPGASAPPAAAARPAPRTPAGGAPAAAQPAAAASAATTATAAQPTAAARPAAAATSGQPATGGDGVADRNAPKQTLRVDFDKLDQLMNLVGELVLGKAGLNASLLGLGSLGRELESERRLARRAVSGRAGKAAPGETIRLDTDGPGRPDALRTLGEELSRVERVFREVAQDLDAASERIDHVSADLRDQVMKLRMVPIAGTFRKHHRTVRDLAHALGKESRLVLEGEDTELDKVLVEQLADPLMHLVRNAVDHGVEPPEVRAAAGKPAEGTIRLSAYHRGNQIAIEVADDGGGIDPPRLREKAREKGIVTEEELATMDDRLVLDLIFRPGFSTAAKVTDVSGRGVGMDVVRNTVVTKLKGTVEVASVVGRGTTFTMRVPLTLAIIQVVLLRAGGEVFAVPLDVVTRTLACQPSDLHRVYDREVLTVRGRQVPILRLTDVLELPDGDDPDDGSLHVVLVEAWGQSYGLICERLLGKQEIVIKTLGDVLQDVPCAAGATLLGDRCAIILDVPAIVTRALRRQGSALARPEAHLAAQAGAAATDGESARRPRVLLIDDSQTTRVALRRLLDGAGYLVTEARDGVEGLELARQGEFELVSTDVTMPRMDGYELTRALRADPRYRDTPIVMVTTRGEKIDRVRGFDAGVDAYITKPHDREELLRVVARCLARGSHAAPNGPGAAPDQTDDGPAAGGSRDDA